jgi:hypothetical protein
VFRQIGKQPILQIERRERSIEGKGSHFCLLLQPFELRCGIVERFFGNDESGLPANFIVASHALRLIEQNVDHSGKPLRDRVYKRRTKHTQEQKQQSKTPQHEQQTLPIAGKLIACGSADHDNGTQYHCTKQNKGITAENRIKDDPHHADYCYR